MGTALLALGLLAGVGEPPPSPLSFGEVARRAASARERGALEEAVAWYRQGVEVNPTWKEGWWHLGALQYATDRWAAARIAFDRLLALEPDMGLALALRGLCEFELGETEAALEDLARAATSRSIGNPEITRAVRLRLALLRIHASQFELAMLPLQSLVREGAETPAVTEACGLVLLRAPCLPSAIPADRRELVRAAGKVACSGLTVKHDETRRLFQELLARYPDVPNLHYGYGLFVREANPAEALRAHRREIEVQPEAVLPRLEIALGLLLLGDHNGALPYAEEAVGLAPRMAASHHVLGQVLQGLGDVGRAVAEMEEAVRLAPESPEMRFALVRAYHLAGRKEDSERERAVFGELEARREGGSTRPEPRP